MATYGYDQYGSSTYGPSAPTGPYPGASTTIPVVNTAYVLPGFTATPQDYANILVEWGAFQGTTLTAITEFRLVANPWGFPVDQNDGTILFDVTGAPPAPGYQYLDSTGTPGRVSYYGIYVLVGTTWLRAGFTACLLPRYYGYDIKLMSDLPVYFQNQQAGATGVDVDIAAPSLPSSGGSVVNPYSFGVNVWLSSQANVLINGVAQGEQTFFVLPANGTVTISYTGSPVWQWIVPAQNSVNTTLADYLKIIGYGLDIVKSDYDMKFRSLNAPMSMSLGDLSALSAEIGLKYNPEIPPYAMRKAALFWAQVMKERGTIAGIAEHITLLTGYPVDLQVSRNFMLDDDQANPISPSYPAWSGSAKYVIGDIVTYPSATEWSIASSYAVGAVVTYNDLLYTCISPVTQQPPTNVTFWSQNVNGPYDYVCIASVTTLPGTAPSGSFSANATWQVLYGGNKNGSEYTENVNISGLSGHAGTWEFMESNGTQLAVNVGVGFPTPQAWPQSGTTPVNGPNGYGHTFRAANSTGSTQANTWLRSVCRSAADIAIPSTVPDPQLVVEHAVPVPSAILPWSATKKYQTNDLASSGNVNYIALRQSLNAKPPVAGAILNSNYDFETSIAPWTAGSAPTGTTLVASQSTTQAYHGTHSMKVAYAGTATTYTASAAGVISSEHVPVIPGATYKLSTLVFGDTANSRMAMAASFFDAFGTAISTTVGTTVTLVVNTWTATSQVITAPSNAATMALAPEVLAPASNASSFTFNYYFDVTRMTMTESPEWGRLGDDARIPVTMSGYTVADLGFNPTVSTTITPFVEWYDNWGNLIVRTFARSPSTSGGYPTGYQFDAFNSGPGTPLAGHVPVNPASVWSVPVGEWTISTEGIAYAGTTDNDALAIVDSAAAGFVGATVTNPAQAGDDCGPVFWYLNTSNFWLAGLLALYYVASGTTRIIAYTGTASAGDRIKVEFNNTTSVTTLPNSTTVTGPSAIVYKNQLTQANILVVVGSGGSATQVSMGSLISPYLPSTGATTSNAGIGSIVA